MVHKARWGYCFGDAVMSTKMHWESVYETKPAESVSWYAPHLRESLRYVTQAAANKQVAIIDVGGGESTLVDDLVNEGYSDITVLDIAATALEVCGRHLTLTLHLTGVSTTGWPVEVAYRSVRVVRRLRSTHEHIAYTIYR
jgi:hypothetical protein